MLVYVHVVNQQMEKNILIKTDNLLVVSETVNNYVSVGVLKLLGLNVRGVSLFK